MVVTRRPVTVRSEPFYRPLVALFLSVFRLLRLRVSVSGAEHLPADGAAVVAISHFGYLEFAFIGAAAWWQHRRLLRFLATAAAFRHPLSGPFMRGMGHLPVDPSAGRLAYRSALDALAAGELVGIFPEGGVSSSWQLAPFKTGAVRLAAEAGVPLVPAVVWGGHRILTRGRRLRVRDAAGVPVTVVFGPPVPTDGPAAEASAALRASMQAMLCTAQQQYPDRPHGPADQWWLPRPPREQEGCPP